MPAAYPASVDVAAALVAQGLTVPSNLDAIRTAVIADWERRTGYKPFLGDTVDTVRTYDPPYTHRDFELYLGCGFHSITSIVINSVAKTVGVDYDLLPLDAANEGRGWNRVRFRFHPGYVKMSVVVTGHAGYAATLPDDVYQVLFDEMQARGLTAGQSGAGTVKRVKQGMREVEYDITAHQSKLALWHDAFEDAIIDYVNI